MNEELQRLVGINTRDQFAAGIDNNTVQLVAGVNNNTVQLVAGVNNNNNTVQLVNSVKNNTIQLAAGVNNNTVQLVASVNTSDQKKHEPTALSICTSFLNFLNKNRKIFMTSDRRETDS
jgi:hypothetical protein